LIAEKRFWEKSQGFPYQILSGPKGARKKWIWSSKNKKKIDEWDCALEMLKL